MKATSAASRVLNTDELLGMVFTSCLKDDGVALENSTNWRLDLSEHCQYPRPSGTEAPLLLAHICRHWRNVALDTPNLWAQLRLEIPRNFLSETSRLEGRLCALHFWLAHSRSTPISVRLCLDNQYVWNAKQATIPVESKAVLTKIAETLLEHRHRWENINILFPKSTIMQFYDIAHQDYPNLKHLKLRIHNLPELEDSNSRDRVFSPSAFPSSLRSLELGYMEMRITQSMLGSHLRKLVLKNVRLSRDVFVMFPTAFPLLEKLSFIVDRGVIPDASAEEVEVASNKRDFAVLDHLTSFSLSVFMNNRVHILINSIITPALTHLAVCDETLRSNLDMDIIYLLRRSRAPVEHFFYERAQSSGHDDGPYDLFSDDRDDSEDRGYEGDDNVLLMLKEMPRLSELEVVGPALSCVLYFLSFPNNSPRLTEINNVGTLASPRISDGSPYELYEPDANIILDIIKRRCRKHHTFDNGHRIWLRKISLPVYSRQEGRIRKSAIFRRADVEFVNTWDFSDYGCSNPSSEGDDHNNDIQDALQAL